MTVAELITELRRFPDIYEVASLWDYTPNMGVWGVHEHQGRALIDCGAHSEQWTEYSEWEQGQNVPVIDLAHATELARAKADRIASDCGYDVGSLKYELVFRDEYDALTRR